MKKKKETQKFIIAIDNAFVFLGYISFLNSEEFEITECSSIRNYGTTKGLGQLALEGLQKDTKLDSFGIVIFPKTRLLFKIPCTHESFYN